MFPIVRSLFRLSTLDSTNPRLLYIHLLYLDSHHHWKKRVWRMTELNAAQGGCLNDALTVHQDHQQCFKFCPQKLSLLILEIITLISSIHLRGLHDFPKILLKCPIITSFTLSIAVRIHQEYFIAQRLETIMSSPVISVNNFVKAMEKYLHCRTPNPSRQLESLSANWRWLEKGASNWAMTA